MERRKLIIRSCIFLALLNALVWYFVFTESPHAFSVSFLNVGQGDAIFIEAPNGNQVLIDGGPANGAVLRELAKVMPITDRFIDVVVATHPDADHIGGLNEVFKRFQVGLIIESGLSKNTNIFLAEEKTIAENKIKRIQAKRGMTLDLGGGALMTVLFPDRDLPNSVDANDGSIVTLLSYKDETFLFTGDAPQKVEKYLTALDGAGLDVDVLKAGHHGSKTSTSEVFLNTTTPAYTIISAGKNNRYGHPHPDVLARLRRASTTILSTVEQGTIIFKIDGINRTLQFK
jgi:competence protein ComEC